MRREYHPRRKSQRIRLLDFDDAIIMHLLLMGKDLNAVAKKLFITRPAITNRLRKMSFVFGGDLVVHKNGVCYLTKTGLDAGHQLDRVLFKMTLAGKSK